MQSRAIYLAVAVLALGCSPPAWAQSQVTLTSSLNPINLGQPVTLTATVSGASGGKVTFYDGVSILGTRTLSSGQSTLTTTLLAFGARALYARYSGDASHAPGASAVLTETVHALPQAGLTYGLYPNGSERVQFSADQNPNSIAVADFNGDGNADLAVANGRSSDVSVLLGNGDASFQSPVDYSIGGTPLAITVGDFNGDGVADLAVGLGNNSISVLLGNSDGSFQAAVNHTVGSSGDPVYALLVGDFNGDGSADLAVCIGTAVNVLLGNGDGTFRNPVNYAVGGNLWAISAGDFNGDGFADLIAVDCHNVTALLGNGDGTFQASASYPVGSCPSSVAVADFNGDGRADLAMTNYDNNSVSVLLGNGDGKFQPAVNYAVGNQPLSLAVGDFNGDGKPDLAVANSDEKDYYPEYIRSDNTVFLLLGNGDGTFQLPVSYPAVISPVSLVAGDFNRDGKTDLAVVNEGSGASNQYGYYGSVGILLGGGAAQTINFAPLSDQTYGAAPFSISATASTNNEVTIWSSTPAVCTYSGPTVTIVGGGVCSITASADGDFVNAPANLTRTFVVAQAAQTIDFAPLPDVVFGTVPFGIAATASSGLTVAFTLSPPAVCTLGANNVVTIMGAGLCSIAAKQTGNSNYLAANSVSRSFTVSANTGPSTTTLALSAVSANLGQPVTLTATVSPSAARGGKVTFYDGVAVLGTGVLPPTGKVTLTTSSLGFGVRPLRAYYSGGSNYPASSSGIGTVTVSALQADGLRTAWSYPTPRIPISAATGDFNGDGAADLAVLGGLNLAVLLGNGDGTFRTAAVFSPGGGSVAVCDFNGDGFADLVYTANGTVNIELGNGDGTFHLQGTYPTGVGAGPVVVGDFNGDGRADLAVAGLGYGANTVAVLLGNGDGTFQAATQYAAVNDTSSIAVGDFDGNGVADLAVASFDGGVSVLLGVGDGTFQPAVGYAVGYFSTSVVVGDFNGDGKADLAVTNGFDNKVEVLLGVGDGTFQPAVGYPVGSLSHAAVGDFNGDGKADLATVNTVSGAQYATVYVSVLLGKGDGTFQAAANYSVGVDPRFLLVGDFNADGKSDLAVLDYTDYSLSVLLGATLDRCDISGTVNLSAADVQTVVNEALGAVTAVHDLDGNGVVNVIDVQIVINAALGLGCTAH